MLDRFEEIKKKYIGTFAQKQSEIQGAWDKKDIAHVHELMHKLAGSSGGYGFDELCSLAQKGLKLTAYNQLSSTEEMQQCLDKICSTLMSTHQKQVLNKEV